MGKEGSQAPHYGKHKISRQETLLLCATVTTQAMSPRHKRLSFMTQMAVHLPRQLGYFTLGPVLREIFKKG